MTASACVPSPRRDPFGYANGAFSAEVTGTYLPVSDPDGQPRSFAATVSAGEPFEGDPTMRDLTVTFTAPPSLCGVTVTATVSAAQNHSRPDGAPVRSVIFSYPSDYGRFEVTATGDEFEGFLRFAEALLPIGDAVEVSPVGEDGGYTVTRRTGDRGREAVFCFTAEGEYPQRVKVTDALGSMELTVTPLP